MTRPLAITPGEPAGIGPDIVLMLAARGLPAPAVAVADPALLEQRTRQLGLTVRIHSCTLENLPSSTAAGELAVLPATLSKPVTAGRPDAANAGYVLETLQQAVQGCLQGAFHGLVTGPVHKGIIVESGHRFSGHTEVLGQLTGAQPVMMLTAGSLRVALLTTHLPLKDVCAAVTAGRLEQTLRIVNADLTRLFGIDRPRIAVAGLNPHAGESGHMGREEVDIIEPVLNRLRVEGLQLRGPLPADTLFTPPQLAQCDAVLAMYHDQGLPVLKHAGFGNAVNVTLGLPIIRTSVDHGTALDLAGTGKANPGSLLAAFELAAKLKL